MSEHAPDRTWFGIDIVKLVAGTLAAVSAAVIGSFLGVAGTLAGAAVASLIGGIGTELYAKSLQHGVSRLKGGQVQPPVTAPAAVGTPAVATPSGEQDTPGHFDPVPQAGSGDTRRPKWQLIALPALAFFVLAMGAVAAFEGVTKESLAGMLGDKSAGASTFGDAAKAVSGEKKTDTEQDDNPATNPSAKPTKEDGTPAEGTTPAPGATTTAPQDGATTPTETTAPQPTDGTGTDPGGSGDQGGTDTGTDPGTGDSTGGGTGDTGSQPDSGDTAPQGGAVGTEGLTGQQVPDKAPREVQPAE